MPNNLSIKCFRQVAPGSFHWQKVKVNNGAALGLKEALNNAGHYRLQILIQIQTNRNPIKQIL